MKINDESGDVLEAALRLKNKLGKKIYLTMNIHAHETRLNFLDKELARLTELHEQGLDPDGILVSDAGLFQLIQKKCPWLELHVSTQANVLNSSAIAFWKKLGATRVVMGREVSARELEKIKANLKEQNIDVEIECFVHGAMCMAYSGRCLLSNFMAVRDANEGMCAHTCRWKYKMYLEEEERPGEFIPVEEDQDGTTMMSSKDMCMIEHLRDILPLELDSWKVEGRHKSIYYAAIVSKAYRQAIDLAMEEKPPTEELLELIESVNTRGYFTGFWYGKPGSEAQKYSDRQGDYNENFCFAGVIRNVTGDTMTVEVRNTLKKGDDLDIITPTDIIKLTLDEFKHGVTNEVVEVAHPGQKFCIKLKAIEGVEEGDILRKRLKKEDLVKNRIKVELKTKKLAS